MNERADGIRLLGYALVYVLVGALSLSTASVQWNAAAVWVPSGFATGLILAKGRAYWPSVSAGSFAVNLAINVGVGLPLEVAALLAILIAAANTGEALLTAFLIERHAYGQSFLFHTRGVIRFLLIAPVFPPLISVVCGVTASSFLVGTQSDGLFEVALTWYVANAAGILIFTGLTVLALSNRVRSPVPGRPLEAVALVVSLCLAIQALCGLYLTDHISEWPTPYMIAPLLVWAAFRFGAGGALAAIALVTAGASLGTLNGFVVFPSELPWRSLVYLQIYLAVLAIVTLCVSAAVAEAERVKSELEQRVLARTRTVEQLLDQRETLMMLVAHDLRSPLAGVSNTIEALETAAARGDLDASTLTSTLAMMRETCKALMVRIAGLIAPDGDQRPSTAGPTDELAAIVRRVLVAHRLPLLHHSLATELAIPDGLRTPEPAVVEHILDTVIDNAIRHSPPAGAIRIGARREGACIVVDVSDEGPGIAPERLARIMSGDGVGASQEGAGLGLRLARRYTDWLGGRLTAQNLAPRGARFEFEFPAPGGMPQTRHGRAAA
ncbi:MASE1 domain-containing protein [Aquibium microcysteis]|uniref:sensor histidine kinase n=1 Tax=Aquibium microcysteis TaxID=675281 RepID=UPI00165D1A45|nr:MASE1 domain-containing protein [Aquibium microcysteis]